MRLLEAAATRGATAQDLERYMTMYETELADARRQAFTAAKVALTAEAFDLIKDKTNDDFGNSYISLGRLVKTVGPRLSAHGLTAAWDIDQSKGTEVTVTCILSHVDGHSERVALTVPRDADDRKNELQAIKSSLTYARSMTYEAVCGLAATDANVDDDGAGAGRAGQPQGEETPLERNARLSADQGSAAFQQFWKDCTEAQRRQLAGKVAELQRHAATVKAQP